MDAFFNTQVSNVAEPTVDSVNEDEDIVEETGNPFAELNLASIYGESSLGLQQSNITAENIRPPELIDEDELSDESWAKKIQPKLELEERTNTCSECGAKFKNRSSLRRHKETHSEIKPFKCVKCEFSTTTRQYLNRHIKFRHKNDKSQQSSSINLPSAALSSNFLETPKFDYSLNKAIPSTNSLTQASASKSGGQYRCHQCSYSTDKHYFLRKHSYSHQGFQVFGCDICDFVTTKNRYLVNHMKKHAEGSNASVGSSHSNDSIDMNLPNEFPTNEVKVSAPISFLEAFESADQNSANRSESKWLVSVDPDGKKIYKCRDCNYISPRTNNLRQHERIHNGERFQCEHCNFSTFYKHNLTVHVATHFMKYKFKCDHCPKSFGRRQQLDKHISVNHSQFEFYCSKCKVAFRFENDYVFHLRIHTRKCVIKIKKLTKDEIIKYGAIYDPNMEKSKNLIGTIVSNDNGLLLKNYRPYVPKLFTPIPKNIKNIVTANVKKLTSSQPSLKMSKTTTSVSKLKNALSKSLNNVTVKPLPSYSRLETAARSSVINEVLELSKLQNALLKPTSSVTINPVPSFPTLQTATRTIVNNVTAVSKLQNALSNPINSVTIKPLPIISVASNTVRNVQSVSQLQTAISKSSQTVTSNVPTVKKVQESISKPTEISTTESNDDDLCLDLVVEEEEVSQEPEVIEEIELSDGDDNTEAVPPMVVNSEPIKISLPISGGLPIPTISGVPGHLPWVNSNPQAWYYM